MSTQVFVQRDGVVNHSHDGATRWHDPAAKHREAELHGKAQADKPTNLDELTAEQKKQYVEALAGKSSYDMYFKARDARKAEKALATEAPASAPVEVDTEKLAKAGNGARK